MNTGANRVDWQNKDATLPLLLAGLVSSILCICMCVALSSSGDFINNELAPRLGLIEPTPTPVPCPAIPAGWGIVMNDDFGTNKYGWPLGRDVDEYNEADAQITDGLFRLDIKARQDFVSYYYPPNKTLREFYFSSKTRKVQGPADAEYGLVFRLIGNQKLFFGIEDSGRVRVHARDKNDKWQDLLLNGYSEYINAGQSNELVVIEQGSHYTFCINQHVAGEIYNADYPYGKFAIGVSLDKADDQATFEFDDFIVYAPAK